MNIGKYVPIVATLIVAVVVMTGVVFPTIGDMSSETTTISNDGASWIRMAYITDQSDYSAQYTFGDNISVAGQSGEWEDMILYADSQCTICIVGDYIVKIVGDVVSVSDDPQTVTVSRSNGIVSIDGEPVSESTVSWAYVPVANGKYSSFGADTVPLHKNSALATVGGFAGVYAYNENVNMDVGLVMDADVTEEYINSVKWVLASSIPTEETQPFNPVDPGSFDPGAFDPGSLNPIDIDPINPFDPNENQLMSVPTPTYTDGVWGYELFSAYISGQSTQVAQIVSYSGTGGGAITIPTTVGGYDVYALGKSNGQNTIFGSTVNATDLIIPDFGHALLYVYQYAFADCSGFTGNLVVNQPTIQNKATSFGYTFQNSGFVTATLPSTWINNMTYGYNVFKNCTRLTTVTITDGGYLEVGPSAFEGCTSLTNIDFSKMKYIFSSAFKGCTSLTGNLDLSNVIDYGGYNPSPGGSAFEGCTGLTGSLTLGSGMTQIANNTFKGCGFTGALVIPASVTSIGSQAFRDCTGFTGTLSLPAGLTSIGYGAFRGCTGFTGTLTIPSTVTTFVGGSYGGGGAFSGCTGFTGLTIEQGALTIISEGAFNGCTGMTGILEIPGSVVEIQRNAFTNTAFTGLVLNDGVQKLSNSAYQNNDGAFGGCATMTGVLYIPSSITEIGYNSFRNCGFTSLVVASDAVPAESTSTGYGVFAGTPISQVLNLGSAEYTTTSYGLNAEEVRTEIGATSYMAPVSISETTTKEGTVFDIVAILPIVFVAGLLLTTAWLFIRK